jgi:hypothetical protein
MDSLTLANTFATVVQLVGMFKQERGGSTEIDHRRFIEWLEYHRHEDVKNLICSTAALQAEVTNLLRQDNALILSQLDSINNTLGRMLSQVEGFKGITQVLLPNAELSEQAVSLLRQLVLSGQRNLVYGEISDGAILGSEGGDPFSFTDPLFLSDDVDSLVQCGFLTPRPGGSDLISIYGITRAGANYVKTVDQNSALNSASPPPPSA